MMFLLITIGWWYMETWQNKMESPLRKKYGVNVKNVRSLRNIRNSRYISMGLRRLNEEFVLIDAEEERYEILHAMSKKESIKNTGSYEEFATYLEQLIVYETDRKRIGEFFLLENLIECLEKDNLDISILVKLYINEDERWELLNFIVIEQKEEKISKILLSIRDVTKAQKKEENQQKLLTEALKQEKIANQAKTDFLFNMSHDIRTPMNAIIGFTGMAKKHLDDREKVEDYLNKADMSSQHMLDIINDVLDMARIDSGKIELDSMPINIYKEYYEIDNLFRSSMEEKNLDFHLSIDIEDDMVLGDAVRIKQVIVNLISNAMKYTRPGGKVSVHYQQTARIKENEASYEIRVKDTGIGMSEEYQKHLFEAFERERNSAVNSIQGTGLGLAIVKRLTDLMGGTIVCHSKESVGTEFIFRIKLPVINTGMRTFHTQFDSNLFKGKHILLVEDNDLNREITVDILEEFGFLVEEAKDGMMAVEMVQNSASGYYSMVLMDVQMPYMNGYQATHAIRELSDKTLASVPIIAMTANAFEEDRKRALNAGMNAHLGKPVDAEKIKETLSRYL